MKGRTDVIPLGEARTLPALFLQRVARTPDDVAYRRYDEQDGRWQDLDWREAGRNVAVWQSALRREPLERGDRVAIMLGNCPEWVFFDIAALACGFVVVPLYLNDNPGDVAYILQNSGAKLLLVDSVDTWRALAVFGDTLRSLERVVAVSPGEGANGDPRMRLFADWTSEHEGKVEIGDIAEDDLATIVYTSGTTGSPKGVMLTHANILSNAHAALDVVPAYRDDLFLSFLPLSHTFERTVGYYLPMMAGSTVAYARSVRTLADDFRQVRPTILIAVPLIFQRIHDRVMGEVHASSLPVRFLFSFAVGTGWEHFLYAQGRRGYGLAPLVGGVLSRVVGWKVRDGFGGRLRVAISGGAPLPRDVARLFIGLGLSLVQGYGMTETSPVVSVNPIGNNVPESVGVSLPGVELQTDERGELLVKSPGAMKGYWNNREATDEAFAPGGWLKTGDTGEVRDRHLHITGRVKHIIVMSNGEKVPPGEIENRLAAIPYFDRFMLIGEQRDSLALLVRIDEEKFAGLAKRYGCRPDDYACLDDGALKSHILDTVNRRLLGMPSHARIKSILLTAEPWTVENGFLTPTMKLRRTRILEHYGDRIETLYRERMGKDERER